MKFFQQTGDSLKRTHLHESDHICECCESFDHATSDYEVDDVECERCGSLCCCACHRKQDKK